MKTKLIKNKRGDIPIVILVLGVVAICALALLSFLVSKSKTESEFQGVAALQKMNSEIEKFEFYKKNYDLEEAQSLVGSVEDGFGGKKISVSVGTVNVDYGLG